MAIHASAVVHPSAQIDPSAEIGPFTTVGEHLVIGAGCSIGPHAHLSGHTTLNEGVRVFPFASVGEVPPDLKYAGEPAEVIIGARTVIREGATITVGTAHGTMKTLVGADCLIMSYCHVGHDSIIGDGVILANGAQLGGHVAVEDGAILGALSGVHQFCRIGRKAMLAGGAKVTRDVPPWAMAHGDRARLVGLNLERMRRDALPQATRSAIKRVYRLICRQGMSPDEAQAGLSKPESEVVEVQQFLDFVRATERGLCAGRASTR